ncbi:uncharacterized protein LOC8076868 [Sorghum bicolor]|uniref:Uncharacterized protein n=1 Tax=Sorghum bicolor TaxID=4558 RepID=C5YXJ9_SORBI|nr:uncharacterized protein LOC8076868 [Sorghum bicolor]EES18180.2 hypothetical protein SORBI_3009G128800 [Sorghum bicolor]|eukprot:XP_021302506.1 uncharacterized protein LOC8076868 [Sorghum bicolor]
MSPPHSAPHQHPSLAAGDAKKQPHLGADPNPNKKASSCFGGGGGGDHHHHPKKPSPSAAKLALVSFLAVILLLAADASLTGFGAHRRLRQQYLHYIGVGGGGTDSLSWLSVPDHPNFTDDLLARWLEPGGSPCRDARTANISVGVLDDAAASGEATTLGAGQIHEVTFWALDEAGQRRCLGGDYFEVDLSGDAWKSRPPIVDHGDGSYSFRLQVAPRFAVGEFRLTVVLLFRSFEGLKFSSSRFKYRAELRRIPLLFRPDDNASLPALETCRAADFSRDVWSGRWTRLAKNDSCEDVDAAGRYRCLEPDHPCEAPWCDGPLGALESNGWVYSAHCSFKLFAADAAWRCLDGKWLFFWGDSNHVDTIRNLLTFVLGITDTSAVTRRFDAVFTNPSGGAETLRITSIFNGHWNMSMNYLGLHSLRNRGFRQLIRSYFMSGDRVPDVVVLNSGLHDGCYWTSVRAYTQGAEFAAQFWSGVMAKVRAHGHAVPRVFYRTTIATGGYARDLAFNPNKMEAFNGVLVEKMRQHGVLTGGVIDNFDMTFPWHYDNRCNDGVHYGRAPARLVWRDGKIGHQYFVDLMLGHVLLNAICNG